jgi:hypothetical protein
VQVVILPGDVEIVGVAARAGQLRRPGIGRQIEHPLGGCRRHHRHRQIRPDDAGHHVHVFGLDHPVGQLHGDVRLALVVLDDHLDVVAARLGDRQQEAVAHVDPKPGAAARQGGDHADLDLGRGRPGRYQHARQHEMRKFHGCFSPFAAPMALCPFVSGRCAAVKGGEPFPGAAWRVAPPGSAWQGAAKITDGCRFRVRHRPDRKHRAVPRHWPG